MFSDRLDYKRIFVHKVLDTESDMKYDLSLTNLPKLPTERPRSRNWPDEVSLSQKLRGSREVLVRTAALIAEIGLGG